MGYKISTQQINTETGVENGNLGANKSKRHFITYVEGDSPRILSYKRKKKITYKIQSTRKFTQVHQAVM